MRSGRTTCVVSSVGAARPGSQAHRHEHRKTWPVLHAITPNGANWAGGFAGWCFRLPVSEVSSCGTERSESGGRAGESARSRVAAQRSDVKQIETPESGGRPRRQSANQSAQAQTHRTEHRSRSDCSQSADAFDGSRGPRSPACVAPDTRRLDCLRAKRGRHRMPCSRSGPRLSPD